MINRRVLGSFIFIFIFFYAGIFGLHAEAPELRNVMPNSWRKVTRLTAEEESRFLRNNTALLEKIVRESLGQPEISLTEENRNIIGTTRVYRETVGEDIFYRFITVNSDTQDFSNQWEIQFLQALVYEFRGRLEILAIGSYNSTRASESLGIIKIRKSIDIIRSGNRAKGILTTFVQSTVNHEESAYTHLVKGQPWGINTSLYVLMQDIVEIFEKNTAIPARLLEEGIYLYGSLPSIRINASYCLIDPNIPLLYSLQNAFDGDPSTSYVENTENDLMYVQVYIDSSTIQRFAVINGYAQNLSLYNANNRIKVVGSISQVMLDDNVLEYQIFDSIYQSFSVIDIYKGDRYNDTCLAEFNIYTTMYGWLFGDIDE